MEQNTRPLIQEIIELLKKRHISSKEILSFAEACEWVNLSPSFMYKMTALRKIPHFIPNGKMIYFKRSELENWLTSHRIETEAEIKNETINSLTRK